MNVLFLNEFLNLIFDEMLSNIYHKKIAAPFRIRIFCGYTNYSFLYTSDHTHMNIFLKKHCQKNICIGHAPKTTPV